LLLGAAQYETIAAPPRRDNDCRSALFPFGNATQPRAGRLFGFRD
jgi:hypothetical protein